MGASAGGVTALADVVATLSDDFPAPIAVVLHLPSHGYSALPDILARAGQLPAHHGVDGELLQSGTIYVAPPDTRLLVGAIVLIDATAEADEKAQL